MDFKEAQEVLAIEKWRVRADYDSMNLFLKWKGTAESDMNGYSYTRFNVYRFTRTGALKAARNKLARKRKRAKKVVATKAPVTKTL